VSQKEIDYMLKLAFEKIDDDGSGELGTSEFAMAWFYLGLPGGEAEMRECFKAVDVDGSGLLDFDEFKAAILYGGFDLDLTTIMARMNLEDDDGGGAERDPEEDLKLYPHYDEIRPPKDRQRVRYVDMEHSNRLLGNDLEQRHLYDLDTRRESLSSIEYELPIETDLPIEDTAKRKPEYDWSDYHQQKFDHMYPKTKAKPKTVIPEVSPPQTMTEIRRSLHGFNQIQRFDPDSRRDPSKSDSNSTAI